MIHPGRPVPERSVADLLLEMESAVLAAGGTPRVTPRGCGGIRESDEVMCPSCGLRWALSEDRPECPRR